MNWYCRPVRGRLLILIGVVALAGGACTSPSAVGTGTATTIQRPLPAGPRPSAIAKQVCQSEAHREIDSALGEKGAVSTPTWVGHLYSCRYIYPTGSMVLSVKELSSWPETDAYFGQLAAGMGKERELPGLGQGGFQTTNGSVVVRKDWKVLTVEISGLPPLFGVPPTSAGDVAVTVGDVILGCWAGD